MKRKNVSSGAKWESMVGYSRAVRMGNTVVVSGTVSIKNGEVYGIGDPYLQTLQCLEIIREALASCGVGLEDVMRTRIYVTDIQHWSEVGKAHGEVFAKIRPATSMVEVSALISPEYLVEIEATAMADF